ncbi:hypothetical protein KQH21_06765 [Streptomyces sp. IpFD-1.1]|uniref:hypothetical protein n=1 Tax=Streptomyces sp. IpFD-1.1 TaxID=2841664 RepID=UPI002094DDFA|nr:hypothetical protein [Streptomyces sp. IpFD-1.1]MCO6747874.1 hypothetical protein [Streptomyces sp. IpFD-1.1]
MAFVPQDVLDRIAALEREVRQLRGRAQMRPALNQVLNGDVTIGEGGRLIVQDPDGTAVFSTGQTPGIGDYYTLMRRDTGDLAFAIGANSFEDDDAPSQMVRTWSRDGSIILMDDYYSDEFLGRPWMPAQLHPTERQSYTGTSYAAAWVGTTPAHNAVLYLRTSTYANAGGGQVRAVLTYGGTETTLDEWDCPAGQWTSHTITHPLHGVRFLGSFSLSIDHRNKSTGQNCETRVWSAYTRNTFTEAEAPDPPPATVANAAAAMPLTASTDQEV